jgi:hypothetical protein
MNERTVEQLLKELEHLSGVKVRLRWMPGGWYLEDSETGSQYPLGAVKKWEPLSPNDQESICRGLFREHWIVLLGLGAPNDD